DTTDLDEGGYFNGIAVINDTGVAVGSELFYTQTGGGLIPPYKVKDPWKDLGFYSREVIPMLLRGMVRALQVVAVALVIGFFLALIMTTFRTVNSRPLNILSTAYSDFFRNTPLLVQLFFITFGLPEVKFDLLGWHFAGVNPSYFWDGVITFSLNTGAYQSEIIRSGILAIPKGQMEAARSLGMSNFQSMRYIILPQAVRITIPPLANEAVNMFLNSSLLSTIGYEEITRVGWLVIAMSFLVPQTFLFVAATYFVITYTITQILRRVEKKLRIPGLGGGAL
ncbi:MAG: amino acid ABC transporter permease, partial [Candidatus Kariarchaeaceae archaeon]